jgi:hypothetical protein
VEVGECALERSDDEVNGASGVGLLYPSVLMASEMMGRVFERMPSACHQQVVTKRCASAILAL